MKRNRDIFYACLIALLIPMALFFSRIPYAFYWIGLIFVLAAPSGVPRGRILILVSLVLAFFAPRIYNTSRFLNSQNANYGLDLFNQDAHPWLHFASAGLLPLAMLVLVFELARFASRQSPVVKNWIKFLLPAAVVLLLSIAKASSLLLLFALTLAFCTWLIVLSLSDEAAEKIYGSRKNFWIFTVFFWADPLPHFPVGALREAVEPKAQPAIDYRLLFLRALEITALSLLSWLAGWFVFIKMEVLNPWSTGTTAFIAYTSDVWIAWVSVLTLGFRFLVRIYAMGAVAAFTLALFGVIPVFNVNRPWLAKSFHEFIGRTMYFYNLALTSTYWPLYIKGLRRLKLPDRVRLAILVFMSALFFSFTISSARTSC